MQENETPIEDNLRENGVIPTDMIADVEPPVFADTSQDTDTDEVYVEPNTDDAVPIIIGSGTETPPPVPTPGKYDAVYNPEAYSRRNMRQGHKTKKVERLFVRGEQIAIKGALFKVTAVGHKTMTLQLLPQPKETDDAGTES